MRSRFKTTVVICVVLALALAVTGVASAPAAKQAPAVAQQAKKKQKKVKAGPIPPDFFGVVPLFAPSASDAQKMSAAGVQTVRLFAYWGLLEPQPGVYNWPLADAVIQNAAAAGLTPALQFANSPGWIAPNNPNSPPIYSNSQIAAWQQFLANFIRRYGAHGSFWAAHPSLPYHPVASYEIWNEPNLRLNWGGPPNPRNYLKLLQVSAPVIRANDPSAKVVFAGLFPFPRPEFGMKGLKFLTKFYRGKGAKKTFDALSLHPYSFTPKQVVPTVMLFRKLLNAHHSAKKAIWITELGWTTGGHDWAIAPFKATEAQQAQYLTSAFNRLIRARGQLRLQRLFWHDWQDHPDPDTSWLNDMGLLRANGSPKPSYFAYQAEAKR